MTVPGKGEYAGTELELLISRSQINKRVANIADQLSKKFEGRCPLIIGILNGSFVFMADLVRKLACEFEVDFIKLSSYGSATESSGTVRLLKDISADVTDRDVVIVEDIIDTGLSMEFLKHRIEAAAPNSVTIATLLYKEDLARIDFPIDYIGFNIPDRFVVGYGLDVDQKLRGLDAVYALKEN
jgi:hypoxanthine phosphoribosyltransferase